MDKSILESTSKVVSSGHLYCLQLKKWFSKQVFVFFRLSQHGQFNALNGLYKLQNVGQKLVMNGQNVVSCGQNVVSCGRMESLTH